MNVKPLPCNSHPQRPVEGMPKASAVSSQAQKHIERIDGLLTKVANVQRDEPAYRLHADLKHKLTELRDAWQSGELDGTSRFSTWVGIGSASSRRDSLETLALSALNDGSPMRFTRVGRWL